MASPLPENSHMSGTITFKDANGNTIPAPAGATAVWASTDTTVGTAVADPTDATGMTCTVFSNTKAGVFTVQLTVNVPGDPASPYTGIGGDVTVGAGALSAIDITFSAPVPN